MMRLAEESKVEVDSEDARRQAGRASAAVCS